MSAAIEPIVVAEGKEGTNDESLQTPLLLGEEQQQNNETLSLERLSANTEEGDDDDDFVGTKAAILSLCSGILIVLPILSFPVSLMLPWTEVAIRGTLQNGTSTIEQIMNYKAPSETHQTIFDITGYLLREEWVSVGSLLIVTGFILPYVGLVFNTWGVYAVHQLSVLKARQINNNNNNNPNNTTTTNVSLFGTSKRLNHKQLGIVFSVIEYIAKFTQYGVYIQPLVTACLSELPFHFGGSFSPSSNHTSNQQHGEKNSYLRFHSEVDVSFGQFFYTVASFFLIFTVVLLRFHWYGNKPITTTSTSEEEGNMVTENQNAGTDKDSTMENDNDDERQTLLESRRYGSHVSFRSVPSMGQNTEQPIYKSHDFWVNFVIFESGLLAALMIFPISSLPVIKLEYTGLFQPIVKSSHSKLLNSTTFTYTTMSLAEELSKSHSVKLTFWDIVLSFSGNSGTTGITSGVVGFFWIQIVLLPFLTLLSAFILYILNQYPMLGYQNKKVSQAIFKLLRATYTGSNVTVFAITILSITKLVPYISDVIVNDNKFCELLRKVTQNGQHEQCLTLTAYRLPGAYFYLAYGIFLDIFSIVSIEYFQTQII